MTPFSKDQLLAAYIPYKLRKSNDLYSQELIEQLTRLSEEEVKHALDLYAPRLETYELVKFAPEYIKHIDINNSEVKGKTFSFLDREAGFRAFRKQYRSRDLISYLQSFNAKIGIPQRDLSKRYSLSLSLVTPMMRGILLNF